MEEEKERKVRKMETEKVDGRREKGGKEYVVKEWKGGCKDGGREGDAEKDEEMLERWRFRR